MPSDIPLTVSTPVPGAPSTIAEALDGPPLAPALPAGTPTNIGGYAILGVLGRGGMGVVYKAHDAKLKRTIALKMLWAGPDASTDDLVRFRGEAEIIARLQHPNIVQIYDIGQHDGHPFLALEYVEGGGLDRQIQGQPQPPRRAAEIVETLARAIHVAHGLQIIHRDLKPANILVTATGHFKITDFGLAKRLGDSLGFTRTGDVMGTPSYMAPEQAAGRVNDSTAAVDVYSLGAILYELLTGRPPFRGASVPDTLDLVRNEEPASPSRLVPKLHRDLSTICLKCLHKSPGRRYASAEALAEDLRRWLDGDTIRARPVTKIERAWVAVKRRPLMAALTASAGVSAAALTLYAVAASRERTQAELREREKTQRVAIERQFKDSLNAIDGVCSLVMSGSALNGPSGLKPLHETLLGYYGSLIDNPEAMRWSERGQIAAACLRLGDLLSRTGNKARAIEAYQKAGQIYADLDREDGSETTHRESLARTHLESGKQHRDLGDAKRAAEEYASARAAFEAILTAAPERPSVRKQLAEVWHQTGVLLADDAATKTKALEAYDKGRELRQKLVLEFPAADEYRRDLARSHGYAGDVELDLGWLPEADRSYWASHALREKLDRENEDRMQLGRSWSNFGNFQARARAYATALDFFEKSRKVQSKLVLEAPTFTEYRSDLAVTLCRVAELKLLLGQPAEAAGELEAARTIYTALKAIDPGNATFKAGLVEANVLLALAAPDREAARPLLEEARPLAEDLAKLRNNAVDAYYLAALTALDAGRPGLALSERSALVERAGRQLLLAVERGYRRKHSEDLRNDKAFVAVRDSDEFKEAMALYEKKLRGEPRLGRSP